MLQSPDFTSLSGAIDLTSGYEVSTWFVVQLYDAFLPCGKMSASCGREGRLPRRVAGTVLDLIYFLRFVLQRSQLVLKL